MIPLLPDEATLRRLAGLRLRWRAGAAASVAGLRRGPRPGRSREFIGLRPYEIGDDIRDLDPAATRRFDRPHVRLYRQEVEASLLLLVDASASMGYGEPAKLAWARALACALGYLALAHHDRVGAVGFATGVTARLPAARSSGQWRALRDLAGALDAGGPTGFDDVPGAAWAAGGERGLAVILSDFYPPEAFAAGLRRLGQSHLSVVAIQVLSPEETDPAVEGEVELTDLETGASRAGWVGPAQRAAYRGALGRLVARVAVLCGEAGIRHLQASTSMPVARFQDVRRRLGMLGIV